MNKFLGKIFQIFMNILLFLVIVLFFLALYGFYQLNMKHDRYINYFGYSFFEVVSGSMCEAICIDDVVVVKLGNDDLEVSSVITYISGESFVTHRIVEINGDKIVAKGDANNSNDSVVLKEEILGEVVYVIRGLGIWKKVLFSPEVILSISITIILFGIYFEISNYCSKKGENN